MGPPTCGKRLIRNHASDAPAPSTKPGGRTGLFNSIDPKPTLKTHLRSRVSGGFEPIQVPWRQTSGERCRRADGIGIAIWVGPHAHATHSSCKHCFCAVTRPGWRLGASGKRAARHIQRALPRRAVGAANACAAPEQCTAHGHRSAKEHWAADGHCAVDRHPAAHKCHEATKSYSARARCQARASTHAGRGRATLISRRRDGRAARARTQIPGLRLSAALSAVQRGHQYRRARRLA
jgi:hypothetical protein